MQSPAADFLASQGVPFKIFQHAGPIRSLEQAAHERGQKPEQVVRSIVFRLSQDNLAMVLVAGPAQISWKNLRRIFGQSRLTMASQQEVTRVTGYLPGTVTPFGLPKPMPIYVDESVTRQDEISIGFGIRGTAIILTSADLLTALGDAKIDQFAESEG